MYEIYFRKCLVDGLVDYSFLDKENILHNVFFLSALDKKKFPILKDFDILDCLFINNDWKLNLLKRSDIKNFFSFYDN